MRTALIALGIIAIGLLAAATIVDWQRVKVPPVGPSVEQICAEAMQRTPADLSWVAPNRAEKVRGREIKAVSLGELPGHAGSLVRVAGVLHAEFEWVALYPSRAAMEEQPWRSPWVRLTSLWPDEPYWRTKGPSISDRCVVVEGTYQGGAGGHFGMFSGTIEDVLRLDVWSTLTDLSKRRRPRRHHLGKTRRARRSLRHLSRWPTPAHDRKCSPNSTSSMRRVSFSWGTVWRMCK